jgi:hypothetical protein
MIYSETIAALKDFTAAQRRLDAATKQWDDYRYALSPQFDVETGRHTFFFLVKSEFIGEIAREFLSAHNAYERLGAPMPSPEFMKAAQARVDAITAGEITNRFLERVDPFEGGICELGR